MDYLVDTNVWLRSLAVADPMKPVARHVIRLLLRRGVALCVAPQNLVEMWSVCTRPEKDNGFGKTVAVADRVYRVARILTFNTRDFTRYKHIEAIRPDNI